jgi:hypothetical protein
MVNARNIRVLANFIVWLMVAGLALFASAAKAQVLPVAVIAVCDSERSAGVAMAAWGRAGRADALAAVQGCRGWIGTPAQLPTAITEEVMAADDWEGDCLRVWAVGPGDLRRWVLGYSSEGPCEGLRKPGDETY